MQFEIINGNHIPKIGLGTWDLRGENCYHAVLSAFEMGYRHIDTAEMYANEEQVGRAIADSGLDRGEIILTSKVLSSHLHHDAVLNACRESLRKLRLDTIDWYLIHGPNARVPIDETMQAMNILVDEGMVRHIGVSNFSVSQFEAAQSSSAAKLITNQVVNHVERPQKELLAYCQAQDVILTAYSPLARGRLANHRLLQSIGEAYGKTASQVALSWLALQPKVIVIPKSANPARQRENFEIFDFELSKEDVTRIDQISA
jgi:diketogulonate reductase-like aldo/keto reductase